MKYTELKPGMFTDAGLIVSVGESGTDKFWTDTPFIRFFCVDDPYHGLVSRAVNSDEDFKIIHERGTEGYKKAVYEHIKERSQCITDAEGDIDLLRAYKDSITSAAR